MGVELSNQRLVGTSNASLYYHCSGLEVIVCRPCIITVNEVLQRNWYTYDCEHKQIALRCATRR
jgi:hypothetical protein